MRGKQGLGNERKTRAWEREESRGLGMRGKQGLGNERKAGAWE